MPKPSKHVFVCAQTRPPGHPRGSCGQLGSTAVFQTFMQQFEAGQLYGQFALTSTGCLGTCDLGPTVLVYPEGVMYSKVSPADVSEIIEEHLKNGRPVERLLAPAALWS
ncbi:MULTISPECIES: (2Fe-2S) ferredoxin domain-containing protein [Methylococcus]|jgi:(2Fe-2S) ferredoxin|uniref:Ferredoxin, 2Fe-2S n=2 Tax=Methylococcus capsulatus TaxID=414 RepID=Q60C55_METCA|nr:(2Fe-2S) ferredoxin domain-containing protein [Methylococcus capsulatus]AAU90579.1 ferredoxin, 2Fe-2S [Methylococcus capsulatus str. Bath]QXP86263.1 (2Fe-2S) ferredoxin domain-containing protein [Methylococcus capsulatus]QXP89714.1 (2Fe-2S) ferredoxin domain-containing protein [Methylococcus capsulatus]QXP94066.1 (2Fe-2S) ferredoxin domain-containing protein [Methylococcus capsulatus]UQN11197.1 (2Fe-2S) ferredoxin domain-containing protein [Methylococcus capsulatus]